jgi:major outer membrane protein
MESEMKKFGLTILTLLTCGAVYALPLGNPSEASLFLNGSCGNNGSYNCCDPCDPCFNWCDAWGFRVGYYGDHVFNRHLAVDIADSSDTGQDVDQTEIYTQAGYIVMNVCNRFDVFTTLGATSIHMRTDSVTFGATSSVESDLFFTSEFSWSVGARATLWECDCLLLGIEGQYFQTNPDFDNILVYSNGARTYFNNDNDVRYREWQVGAGIAYRFATSCPTIAMVPYAGIKWAGCRFDLNDFAATASSLSLTFPSLENKKWWGYAIGLSLTLCDMIGVNIEGRWGDEKAVYVNGQFRF